MHSFVLAKYFVFLSSQAVITAFLLGFRQAPAELWMHALIWLSVTRGPLFTSSQGVVVFAHIDLQRGSMSDTLTRTTLLDAIHLNGNTYTVVWLVLFLDPIDGKHTST